MPLEVATTIEDLDSSWPLGGDTVNKGDDHLRLLKAVLKTVFPGIDSNGFKKAITATEDQLNYLNTVTSNVQTQLTANADAIAVNAAAITVLQGTLPAPAGTKLLFPQAAAPTGWTIDATNENSMLRVCDGTTTLGGATGGSDSPILMDKVPSHTHTGTSSSNGAHTHTYLHSSIGGSGGALAGNNPSTANTSSNGAHTHTFTTDANGSAANWTPKYVNAVVCTKDA